MKTSKQPAARAVGKLVYPGDVLLLCPGKFPPPKSSKPGQLHGYFSLKRASSGNYEPLLRVVGPTTRFSQELATELGFDLTHDTLRRLLNAGLVEMQRITPNSVLVGLESFKAHMEACKDPHFWTVERIQRYRCGIGNSGENPPARTSDPSIDQNAPQATAKRGERPS